MNDKAQAMVLASLAADSLALGAHWIYDTDTLAREIGRVDRLLAPPQGSYHPTKNRGEFTHYGDQTLLLLESLAKTDLTRFTTQEWATLVEVVVSAYLDSLHRAYGEDPPF